ncbi:hypothetical protein B0O79_1955 [Flavobacteriaceae bacterium MAR_2009_75]|uniref:DUF6327 family protein n=1 Tax=Pseudozobellia sp. WGM2 TaxID=2787625 RepID=UPI000CBFB38D|nr:DUF6327 family protein [Pseudozobellia sp. WGM2]PKA98270.1 hypothetical protein B0O79_1955 [Flavobacteriaceae bacterium MAR_2009_75]
MIPKQYTSFEQIDQDLKILKLQQDIDRENLKLKFNETKTSLYPTNLLGGVGGVIQKLVISLIASKFMKKFH